MKTIRAMLLKTDGSSSFVEAEATLEYVSKLLHCHSIDLVRTPFGGRMVVDDSGMIDDKPINALASQLYPGNIHGDVLLFLSAEDFDRWDEGFGDG